MITKVELEKMVSQSARIYCKDHPEKMICPCESFKSGASFVSGILQPEIDKLEKEIDRVIDVADGNANACNLLSQEIDRLKQQNDFLSNRFLLDIETHTKDLEENSRLDKELSEANATIQSLKDEIEVLRRYGNKDCTAMADEALTQKAEE